MFLFILFVINIWKSILKKKNKKTKTNLPSLVITFYAEIFQHCVLC